MHAKSDSDLTSFGTSSPRLSPKRSVYYVQSPSRDSHDGDKSSSSMQATPVLNSPMESPSHPSLDHHSRASTASRVSGTYNSSCGRKGNQKGNDKWWPQWKVVEEEEGYGDSHRGSKGLSRRAQLFTSLLVFAVVFSVCCLIIWSASRPYKPKLSVKSLTVHNFYLGEGADITGVPTKMLILNCSVKMTVYNPATFFGIHVSSKPVNLIYSDVAVATGELKKYHQQRKSYRKVIVNLQGSHVPLYGAGASIAGLVNDGGVPVKLIFDIKSQGSIVGELVRPKHQQHVFCPITIDSHSNKPIKLQENSCTYN